MKSNTAESRSQRSFKNLISSVVKAFLTAIVGFVVTPYIIEYVGKNSFGTYKLIIDWLSNVWIFDLGVSGAFLAVATSKLSDNKIQRIFSAGTITHFRVLPLLLLACVVIYSFLISIIKIENISLVEYSISFFLVAFSYLFYPFNVFRQYFEIKQRSSLVNYITVYQLVLTNLMSLLFAYLGFGLIGLCAAYSLFILLGYLMMYFLCAREEGWSLKSLLKTDSKEEIEEINKSKKSSLLINISQKISFLGDNTIIAYFYSPVAVVPYFISQRLANLFQSQLQGITFSGWASLLDVYRNETSEVFSNRLEEALKITFFLSLCGGLVIYIFNEPFVYLWMSEEYYISNTFNIIISMLLVVNIQNIILGNILSGAGFISLQSKPYLLTGLANLLLSIFFTFKLGMIGPVLASLITMLILFVIKLRIAFSVFNLKLNHFFKVYVVQLFVVLVLGYVLNRIYGSDKSMYSWVELFGKSIFTIAVFVGSSFLISFSKSERQVWILRIQRLLKKS